MDKIIYKILKKLKNNNYEAYVVGGYVRDKVLGINTNDIDICTNALPRDVINIFKLDNKIKDSFGSINFKIKNYNIDITTYRLEKNYVNHIPKYIEYVNDIKKDLKRRDFTCNQLLLSIDDEIIDYYDGLNDINNKTIKCIGDTEKKLKEDPIRILRAIRLASIYDFSLDENIVKYINNNKNIISNISYTRKKEELDKILSNDNKMNGLKIIKELNLLDVLNIKYDKISYCKDVLGMYAQIEYSSLYSFTKNEKNIINNIRDVIKIGKIDNYALYKYGLYINNVAGEILGVDYKDVIKKYKSLPIKTRKDIKISVESIVKLNNNCYNNINEIYLNIEKNILNGSLKNKSKDIVKFIRK
mgnify:CR=1 FL=1